MADINSISIQVQSSGVAQATTDMNNAATAADNLEGKVAKLGNTAKSAADTQVLSWSDAWVKMQDDLSRANQKISELQNRANDQLFSQQMAAAVKSNDIAVKAQLQAENDLAAHNARMLKLDENFASQSAAAQLRTAQKALQLQAAGFDAQSAVGPSAFKAATTDIAGLTEKAKEAASAMHDFSLANAGTTRELIVLGGEAMRGNFSRIPGSLLVLANRSNGAQAAIQAFGVAGIAAFAAVGVAVTALTVLMIEGAVELDNFNKSLVLTGNYAGLTRDSVESLSQSLGNINTGGAAKAKEFLEAFAATGLFTGDALIQATKTALDFAHFSGESTEEVVKNFSQMKSGVAEWAAQQDTSYHFLNANTYAYIDALEKQGKTQEAATVALAELDKGLDTNQEHVGAVVAVYRGWGIMVDWLSAKIKGLGADLINGPSLKTQMDDAAKAFTDLQARIANTKLNGGFVLPNMTAELDSLYKDYLAKQKAYEDESAAASKKASDDEVNALGVAGLRKANAIKASNASQLEIQQKLLKDTANDVDAANRSSLQAALRAAGNDLDVSKLDHKQIQDEADKFHVALVVSETDYQKTLQDIRDKHKEKNNQGNVGKANMDAQIAAQEDIVKSVKQSYADQVQIQEDAYKHGGELAETYYQTRKDLLAQETSAIIDAYQKEINIINSRKGAKDAEAIADKARATSLNAAIDKLKADQVAQDDKYSQQLAEAQNKRQQDYINKMYSAGEQEITELNKTLVAEQKRGDEIGKTKDQIDALRSAEKDAAAQSIQDQIDAIDQLLDKNTIQQTYIDGIQQEGEVQATVSDDARKAYETELALLKQKYDIIKQTGEVQAANAIKDADAKAAKDAFNSWKDTNKKIGDDLASAIVDGGGKGWKKMLKDMETAFAKAVLQPILAPISGGIASLLNPTAAQAGGTATAAGTISSTVGIAQTASNIYSAITGGISGAIGATATGIGNLIGSSAVSAFGAGVSGGSSVAEAVTAYTAAGETATASALSLGASVSAAVPWVAGAVAVLGVLSSAFGHGPKTVTSQGISGTVSDAGTTGQAYQNWTEKGGWFTSDKNGQDTQALSSDVTNTFNSSLVSMKASATSLAQNLDVTSDALNNYSKTFDITLTSDATANQTAITAFFTTMGDDMATKLIPNIADFAKTGETASVTLQRLSDTFNATNQVAAILGKNAEDVFGSLGLSSDAAREQLVNLAGGISNLTTETANYASSFLTDAEKLAPVQKAVTDAMNSLGEGGITTKDQFKALVDSLDLTTTAGATLYNNLMQLAPSFAQVADAATAASQAQADLLNSQLDLQLQIANLEGDTAGATAIIAQQRQIEISALDASLQPLQAHINALTDEKAAADAAAAAADAAATAAQNLATANQNAISASLDVASNSLTGLQNSVTAQEAIINSSYDAQEQAVKDATALQLTAANTILDNAKTNLANVQSALTSTLSNTFVLTSQNRADAVSTLTQALKSGVLGGDSFNSALKNIATPSEQLYGSFTDYARDQAKNTELLNDLQSKSTDQVDIAQSTIDAINSSSAAQIAQLEVNRAADIAAQDNIVKSAQAQLDALKGINDSVLSVRDALAAFGGSIAAVNATTLSTTAGTTAGIENLYNTLLGRPSDAAGLAYYQNAVSNGATLSQIAEDFVTSPEYASLHPSFDVGTNLLPSDMLANVHQGERIVPKADNQEIIKRLSNSPSENNATNAEVVQSINSLKSALASGDAANVQMTREVFKILRKWDQDGQPETRDVSAISS